LGDFAFKTNPDKRPEDQIISCSPDVQVRKVEPDWQFVVLACDGIWDVLTNQVGSLSRT
jgi:protein phosphatase 2C family protein 2/3